MTSLPNNISEKEVLAIIKRVATKLAYKFRFGYHTIEDMVQQATVFALEGLERYDESRPLENFLWVHVHHQLYNWKRNNFERPNKPCYKCPHDGIIDEQGYCSIYHGVYNCDLFARWYKRNSAKRNLMNPITLANIDDTNEQNMSLPDLSFDAMREIFNILDKEMPMDIFMDYTKLKSGISIPSNRRAKVIHKMKELLIKYGYIE